MVKREFQEIVDGAYEQVLERVCAIDVAKQFGRVCVRVPRDGTEGARRVSQVWTVSATTNAILELGEYLVDQRIQKVTLESTADYWRIFYYLLEACGLDTQLVNARDVKNVPGRPKTDTEDSVWLAKLTERGMLRPSFVPPPQVRVLRDYTRSRIDLTRDRTRCWQRLEKLLEDALIKVSSVASALTTVSTRDMVEALINGQRDPRALANLARGRMKRKRPKLIEALTGAFDDHHAELARMLLDQIDMLTAQIGHLTGRIMQLVAELPDPVPTPDNNHPSDTTTGSTAADGDPPPIPPMLRRLTEIPGIGVDHAEVILAEIGQDMTRFPTAKHLVSWARLSPRTIQSGPKRRGGKTGKGNPYLKGALGQAASAAARTDTFLGERYRRIVRRRGKGKALVAVARSILTIVWHLLADPTATFHDLGADFYDTHIDKERRKRNLIRQFQALGWDVALTPIIAPAAAA
jgi:transposase